MLTDNFHAFFLKQEVTTCSTQLMKKLLENFCKEVLLDLLYINLKVVSFVARKIDSYSTVENCLYSGSMCVKSKAQH